MESTQVTFAFVFDGIETLALADTSRAIPRVGVCCAVAIDLLILALDCGSVFEILLADWGVNYDSYPWVDLKEVAFFYMVAITCVLNISG
jgi:hypothetical protein